MSGITAGQLRELAQIQKTSRSLSTFIKELEKRPEQNSSQEELRRLRVMLAADSTRDIEQLRQLIERNERRKDEILKSVMLINDERVKSAVLLHYLYGYSYRRIALINGSDGCGDAERIRIQRYLQKNDERPA